VLLVENDNPVPVEVVVEIVMEPRGQTLQTTIEDAVNVAWDALKRNNTPMVRVVPARRSPGREDGTGSADSARRAT
jgi:hypothetical protein